MRNLLPLLIGLMVLSSAQAQDYKIEEAKEYFVHQHYADALSVLKSTEELVEEDEEAKFLMAVCYYQLNQLEQSRALLKRMMSENRTPYPECWLYRAKIAHSMHQFGKAAEFYKGYLRRLKSNHPNRRMVWDALRRCATGLRLRYKKAEVAVENLGRRINSEYDEFAPIISPNFTNKLYFSAIRPGNSGGPRDENGLPDDRLGHYYSDMFSCRSAAGGGSWKEVEQMHYLLNSPRHDLLLDFNADGSVLYYFRGWSPEQGQIYVDTFRRMENRTLSSDPFAGPISAGLGDGALYLVKDTLIYFSSRRPGGYGGLDLYRTAKRDGQWTEPENLGPGINSPYDETTPFLARDGITLYYSTNHPSRSIGGLDVVKSVYNEKSDVWTQPELLPIPVNSAGDDAYFRISKDGFTAYFSSSRKDGFGKRDLYAAYFSNYLPEMEPPIASQFAQSEGVRKVRQDVTPPSVDLTTGPEEEADTAEENAPSEFRPAPAASSVAEFPALVFEPGQAKLGEQHRTQLQRIAATLKEHPEAGLVLSAYRAEGERAGQRLYQAIQLAEEAVQALMDQGVASESLFLRAGLSSALPAGKTSLDFAFFLPQEAPGQAGLPSLNKGMMPAAPQHPFNQDLLYKVQISSLRGAFKGNGLDEYDGAMVETRPDFPYYRYTIGAFSSFEEADAFRQELLKGSFSSALVVAYIYGRRADRRTAEHHADVFPDLKNYAR